MTIYEQLQAAVAEYKDRIDILNKSITDWKNDGQYVIYKDYLEPKPADAVKYIHDVENNIKARQGELDTVTKNYNDAIKAVLDYEKKSPEVAAIISTSQAKIQANKDILYYGGAFILLLFLLWLFWYLIKGRKKKQETKTT